MSDLSWLNPTPHAIAVYASQPTSPLTTQHSLPSGRYSLLGPDFHRLDRTSFCLAHSLDHLVGAGEQRGRNFNAKRARGGQIDDQLKLARLHYRQVGRLSTLEDFAGVDADLTVRFRRARSVAHQAAGFRILAYIIDGWNRMSCCQCGKLEAPADKERIRPYHERVGSIANKRSEGSLDLATVARL